MVFSRVQFRDGVIYHDYHFNGMQLAIDKEIKRQAVLREYDMYLVTSDYDYVFVEPVIDTTNIDTVSSNALLDTVQLVVTTNGYGSTESWVTKALVLPQAGTEFLLHASYGAPSGTAVAFSLSPDGVSWTAVTPGTAVSLTASNLYVRASLTSSADLKPFLNSYAVYWR